MPGELDSAVITLGEGDPGIGGEVKLLPQIGYRLRTSRVAVGRIVNLYLPELYSIVPGKVGKAVEFGLSWGSTRLLFILATRARDRQNLHEARFAVRAVEDLAPSSARRHPRTPTTEPATARTMFAQLQSSGGASSRG